MAVLTAAMAACAVIVWKSLRCWRNALAARLLTSIQNSLLRQFSFVFCYFLALFAL
jgi:hypothetical protein